jgi:hypothetical protein
VGIDCSGISGNLFVATMKTEKLLLVGVAGYLLYKYMNTPKGTPFMGGGSPSILNVISGGGGGGSLPGSQNDCPPGTMFTTNYNPGSDTFWNTCYGLL